MDGRSIENCLTKHQEVQLLPAACLSLDVDRASCWNGRVAITRLWSNRVRDGRRTDVEVDQ